MPLGPAYMIYPNILTRADPEVVDWLLNFLARHLPANSIDYVLLFGKRANGEGLDGGEVPRGAHQFMVVVRDGTSNDRRTGEVGWNTLINEMAAEARRDSIVCPYLFICGRADWDEQANTDVMVAAQEGTLFAERLDWIR